MLALVFFIMSQAEQAPDVAVEKEIVYQKETVVDLEGSQVKGESQLPPAFFVTKMNTKKADSLLAQRLKFKLKDYNELGF